MNEYRINRVFYICFYLFYFFYRNALDRKDEEGSEGLASAVGFVVTGLQERSERRYFLTGIESGCCVVKVRDIQRVNLQERSELSKRVAYLLLGAPVLHLVLEVIEEDGVGVQHVPHVPKDCIQLVHRNNLRLTLQ